MENSEQSNVVKRKAVPFSQIPNEIINTPLLSAKSKGIALYFFSKPDGWKFYLADIVKHFKDGIDSIRSGIEELETTGYLVRTRIRNDKGCFSGWQYEMFFSLEERNLNRETPKSENPNIGESNPNNTNNINNTYSKKENIIKERKDSLEEDSIEAPKPKTKKKLTQSEQLIYSLYLAYPKHRSPEDAKKAIAKALKEYEYDFLLDRVNAYKEATDKWTDDQKQYIPYPATWFNKGCYNDDPKEWERNNQMQKQITNTQNKYGYKSNKGVYSAGSLNNPTDYSDDEDRPF